MKKLFTLVALLACFLGAKAEWVEDYKIDYSTKSGFPFYVMGYVPEWVDGVMTDYGAMYGYLNDEDFEKGGDWTEVGTVGSYHKVQYTSAQWHQYFIADGIPTEIDGSYKVTAYVKASESVNVNVNMGWGWGSGEQVSSSLAIGTEWAEVECEFTSIAGTSCNLVAQPGGFTGTIEWKWVKVEHNAKASRPTTWQEWLTSDGQPVIVETTVGKIPTYMGNAETPWADATVRFNDQEKNYLICAWSKEKDRNMNENNGWDPFPADIEVDETDPNNHVFVCHGQPATTEGDPSAWDNQFWIQSPKSWKEGEQLQIHFRYRANRDGVKTNTQCHKQNPSDYKHWAAIGDITFNQEWQTFDKVISWPTGAGDGESWSIAFNLNPEVKDAVNFYFDDLSWQSMKLDEGYFIASCNTETGLEYDFDNAIEFTEDEDAGCLVAVVGEKNAYINQVMISTVRGNDAAFKSNTLKPSGAITNDPDNWQDYAPSSIAKLTLPGSGIWKIYLDPGYTAMAFEMLEGEIKDPLDVVTNKTEIIVKGLERADIKTGDDDTDPTHTGAAWDNQFWFKANRTLAKGEVTHLKFKYKASKEAKTTTQCHGNPGGYMHWGCIGDVNFNTDWQEFNADFTVPSEADGMQCIAFNMAEIKEACDYEITDVQWYMVDSSLDEGKTWENLINETGTENFYVKIGAGTDPYQYGTESGINEVVNKAKVSSAAIYNLAGQRVSKDFKGIVVKDGRKAMQK